MSNECQSSKTKILCIGLRLLCRRFGFTKESILKKTYDSKNLPSPLFALRARGPLGPAAKEG